MKPIYVVLIFLQKMTLLLLIVHKNHIQPCFDMQLFELMPLFQRLQGVAFQHSSETQYLFSQRLVAWVCLTLISKAITYDMLYLFLQRLFPRCCLFLQKVRGPFLSKPELPLQSHCRQSPPAFGNSCGPHAMWQLASPTGPSYKLPKGLMSCHQSQCQCFFSRHTPPFHLPHTFACRNVPLLHLLLPLPPTI